MHIMLPPTFLPLIRTIPPSSTLSHHLLPSLPPSFLPSLPFNLPPSPPSYPSISYPPPTCLSQFLLFSHSRLSLHRPILPISLLPLTLKILLLPSESSPPPLFPFISPQPHGSASPPAVPVKAPAYTTPAPARLPSAKITVDRYSIRV